MRDLQSLRLFARVARLGSFSAAAREIGLSQPQVSRAIADLEADLGALLLVRTSRAVVLTEAGARYLSRIEPILLALDSAGEELREQSGFKGRLRLSMPASIGTRVVIPALQGFVVRHPDLQVEVLFGDAWQDLVRDAVDVAFRIGRLPETRATARRIAAIPRVIVAAPSYLALNGTPNTPGDLAGHRVVSGPAAAVPNAWRFERGSSDVSIDLTPHFFANDNVGAVAAAAAGLGITSTTLWSCQREIEAGVLVPLLRDWSQATSPLYASFPMGRETRAVARAVVEHVDALLPDAGGDPPPLVDTRDA